MRKHELFPLEREKIEQSSDVMVFADQTCVLVLAGDREGLDSHGLLRGLDGRMGSSAAGTPESITAMPRKS